MHPVLLWYAHRSASSSKKILIGEQLAWLISSGAQRKQFIDQAISNANTFIKNINSLIVLTSNARLTRLMPINVWTTDDRNNPETVALIFPSYQPRIIFWILEMRSLSRRYRYNSFTVNNILQGRKTYLLNIETSLFLNYGYVTKTAVDHLHKSCCFHLKCNSATEVHGIIR